MTTDERLDRLEALQDSLERIVASVRLAVGDLRHVIAGGSSPAVDQQRKRTSEQIHALLLVAERRVQGRPQA
jgi:hypothetical protein